MTTNKENNFTLTCDTKKALIEYIQKGVNGESSLTLDKIKILVCEFAQQYNVPNPLESDGVIGKNWLKEFFRRHAYQFTSHNSTDVPAMNCADLFRLMSDFSLNSEEETQQLQQEPHQAEKMANASILEKLLEGDQLKFQQDTDWSLNSNEYISIDHLAYMCPACHRSFPDIVQLNDHKCMTGQHVPNVLLPVLMPSTLMYPNSHKMFNTPHFSNNQGPQVRPPPLKPKPQRLMRSLHPQIPSPSETLSPSTTTMDVPSLLRAGLLNDILVEPDFSPPTEKEVETEEDDDCEIVFSSPGICGLPKIQSVHGGIEQPQDNNNENEAIQLNNQITVSHKNKYVNKSPKEVANILTNRGITVTHKTNWPGGPSAAAKCRCEDSSLISCPLTDRNKLTQVRIRIPNLTKGRVACNLCPALCYDQRGLIKHHRQNHQRGAETSASELGLPVIDLKNDDTKQKLAALGITNYIPLSSGSGFPVVSFQSAANPNICNMSDLGVTSLLSLGPIMAIPTKKSD